MGWVNVAPNRTQWLRIFINVMFYLILVNDKLRCCMLAVTARPLVPTELWWNVLERTSKLRTIGNVSIIGFRCSQHGVL